MNTIEFFLFESDFVQDSIRCIPMVARLKLDLAGIKLSLTSWCRISADERYALASLECDTPEERRYYRQLLIAIIFRTTGEAPVEIPVEGNPLWENRDAVPIVLQEHASLYGWIIDNLTWAGLTRLQRFALLKLCRPGHENKNFPLAMQEFGIVNQLSIKPVL